MGMCQLGHQIGQCGPGPSYYWQHVDKMLGIPADIGE